MTMGRAAKCLVILLMILVSSTAAGAMGTPVLVASKSTAGGGFAQSPTVAGSAELWQPLTNKDVFTKSGVIYEFMQEEASPTTYFYNYSADYGQTYYYGGLLGVVAGSSCGIAGNHNWGYGFGIYDGQAYYVASTEVGASPNTTICVDTGSINEGTLTWGVETHTVCPSAVCGSAYFGDFAVDVQGNVWECLVSSSADQGVILENGVYAATLPQPGFNYAGSCGVIPLTIGADIIVVSQGAGSAADVVQCLPSCTSFTGKSGSITGQYIVSDNELYYVGAIAGHTNEAQLYSFAAGTFSTVGPVLTFPASPGGSGCQGQYGLSADNSSTQFAIILNTGTAACGTHPNHIYYTTTKNGGLSWSAYVNETLPVRSSLSSYCSAGQCGQVYGGVYIGGERAFIFENLIVTTSREVSYLDTTPPSKTLTASILNPDCGNCVIAGNNKYYDVRVNVTSPAVDSAHYNSSFDDVKIYFNDTVHDVYIEYNYLTASTYFVGTLNDGIVTFAASTAELTYDQALGTYTATVDFFIQFNSNALDAQNRAIWVQACLVNGSCVGYGTAPISAPFNIINQGGLTNTIAKGTCAHTAGGDIFADTCTYSYVGSKIQTNATFYNLQSFSTQFSMTSGGTATNSSQKALTQRFGFYFWDGSTWVLGPNVLIAVLKGHAYSSQGGYTLYETVYYYGATLISNQTVSVYLEPTTPAQNRFYVDMWYSNINASTTWGMRVNAYYVGMSESGWWIWSNWSPTYTNQSTSQAFGSIYDHAGKLYSSSQITCTKVFETLQYVKHTTPYFATTAFVIEQFNTAGNGNQPGGVATPIYTQPLVPIIQSTSNFFSPIYAAISAIASLFIKGLQALGNVVWAGLAAKFPWFTNTISAFAGLVINFIALLVFLESYLIAALAWFLSVIGLLTLPLQAVGSAYAMIIHTYGFLFGHTNVELVLEAAVILAFAIMITEAADSKNPTHEFISIGRGAWSIANTIFDWTWRLVSFLVSAIEGLIP